MKKGFTLIELLAVIVILAIIAIIATPIITDVIESSKESANLRSIEGYAKAVKQKYYNDSLGGGKPVIDSTFLSNVETSGGEVKCDSVLYNNGSILYKCTVQNSEKKYCYANEQHYACDDPEFLDIFKGSGGVETLDGSPIIEKTKELVYENGACKTDGTTYNYMGGCYLKGNPNNNYIWYSGFLWRIMGINADGTVRLITDENVTAISYHENYSSWDGSYAKDWLNNYFYPRLKGNNIIKEETWCSETTTSSSSVRTECTTNLSTEPAYVGLITLDEYNLADGKNSYLNIKQNQWTITTYNSYYAWPISHYTNSIKQHVEYMEGLRAVINVNSSTITTGGDGTLATTWSNESGPYILNEDKNLEITGKLNEKATSGEYVTFAGKKYRVIDKDSNGNTKLMLDGYYEEDGSVFTMTFGDDKIFSTTAGIGQKLNTDVLEWLVGSSDTINRNKLVSNYTWYQNHLEYGNSYTVSLNEENPTSSINATVGLIRVGEMLSSQSSSILTKGYTIASNYNNASSYWVMNNNTISGLIWYSYNVGSSSLTRRTETYGLRPVIVIRSDVNIISGNGTWSNPYEI